MPRVDRTSRRMLIGGLAACIVAAVVAGFRAEAAQVAQLRGIMLNARPELARVHAMDAFAGRTLPDSVLVWLGVGERKRKVGELTVVWIVDAKHCSACLSNPGPWNSLARNAGVSARLVLAGVQGRRAAEEARRAGITSSVIADPTRWLLHHERALLPSTKLLIDREGQVLAVDGAFRGPACNSTFERVVAAFLDAGPGAGGSPRSSHPS